MSTEDDDVCAERAGQSHHPICARLAAAEARAGAAEKERDKWIEEYGGFIASAECPKRGDDGEPLHALTLCLCEYAHNCIWCTVDELRARAEAAESTARVRLGQLRSARRRAEAAEAQVAAAQAEILRQVANAPGEFGARYTGGLRFSSAQSSWLHALADQIAAGRLAAPPAQRGRRDGMIDEGFFIAPDGREDAEWMRPYRDLVEMVTDSDAAKVALNVALDDCYMHGITEAGEEAESQRKLLGAILRAGGPPLVPEQGGGGNQ